MENKKIKNFKSTSRGVRAGMVRGNGFAKVATNRRQAAFYWPVFGNVDRTLSSFQSPGS